MRRKRPEKSVWYYGKVETILKAERPWTPTGVFVHDGQVYVLEYSNGNDAPEKGWRPRVRRLSRDGKVTTLLDLFLSNKP